MTDARMFYRENAIRGASRVGLVVLLYEQMIEDLRQAIDALDEKQIELRTRHINHAIVVIGHLQGTLNLAQGGKVARHLDAYYNFLRTRLVEAQAHSSKEILREQIETLLGLRAAWIEVDRAESGRPSGVEKSEWRDSDSRIPRSTWRI
jgi:flagellar secretion chaperone FliS